MMVPECSACVYVRACVVQNGSKLAVSNIHFWWIHFEIPAAFAILLVVNIS